jgi:hypothetical protein
MWVEYHETEGSSFNSWMEMTKNWKEIPQATKDKAQPFLLEDMQGTNKHSPNNGMIQDLLHSAMKLIWQDKSENILKQNCPSSLYTAEASTKPKKPSNL